MRYSQCFISLSVLYTVYFVVRCCDLCGVLMYLFILFQLCRIYNETKLKKPNHNTIFFVFLFPYVQQAICCFVISLVISLLFPLSLSLMGLNLF